MAELLRPGHYGMRMHRRRTSTRVGPGARRLRQAGEREKADRDEGDVTKPPVQIKFENSYRLQPEERERFQAGKVETVMQEVLEERLRGVTYDLGTCQSLAKRLSDEIVKRVKEFRWHRYKIICQVSVGQQSQQCLQVASRCIWDYTLDSQASVTYHNASLFAVAQCYGIYYE